MVHNESVPEMTSICYRVRIFPVNSHVCSDCGRVAWRLGSNPIPVKSPIHAFLPHPNKIKPSDFATLTRQTMSLTPGSGVAPAPRALGRSRKTVKYYDTDDEDLIDEDDNVYAAEPPTKVRKTTFHG